MKKILQRMVSKYFVSSGDASYDWAGRTVAAANPKRLLDVGCGNGGRLFNYLKKIPAEFHGVEGNPLEAARAREKQIQITSFDLNGRWSYQDDFFDGIHSSQVIEHVHNTRLFLSEAYRVLAPGGVMVMTSENLCSLLNLSAMFLGYTPFSLLAVGGWYLGNPLGLHYGKDVHAETPDVPMDDPAYSGIMGHNRVLSVLQARDLLQRIGFTNIEVRSIGLMPLPRWIGRPLEKLMPRRGHWLLIRAEKSR
jgi:SAM-dependent methyltransferase